MAEAVISRRGQGAKKASLRTQVITVNGNFIVPNSINGAFDVMVFGGGGAGGGTSYAGYNCGAGGGGWMNNGTIDLVAGTQVPITIGAGGVVGEYTMNGGSGGTTSFGIYLSANGGGGGLDNKGGSGGSGGGCVKGEGGDGYQFGGGGCCHGNGGNGGPWGGGGGCGGSMQIQSWYGGKGGLYGGNGGNCIHDYSEGNGQNGEDGTNTMGISSIPSGLRGYGKGGIGGKYYSGGYHASSGGGGGYGGNGGNGGRVDLTNLQHGGGGGGGGYGPGAIGGHGEENLPNGSWASNCNGGGGGGGYNCPGASCNYSRRGYSGGGGGYSPELASGGNFHENGKPGVCIIQYYVAE